MLSKANENIINYIKMQFHEDISNFISTLSKQQILDIQDRLFDYTSIEELKKSLKNINNKILMFLFYLSFQKSTGSYSCNCARNPAF